MLYCAVFSTVHLVSQGIQYLHGKVRRRKTSGGVLTSAWRYIHMYMYMKIHTCVCMYIARWLMKLAMEEEKKGNPDPIHRPNSTYMYMHVLKSNTKGHLGAQP